MSTYSGHYEPDRAFGWKIFAVVAGFLIQIGRAHV